MLEDSENETAQQTLAEKGKRLAHRHFLDGEPVAVLLGDEFESLKAHSVFGESIEKRIARFYEEGGNAEIDVAGIGKVRLDLRAVRRSRGHGNQPERLAAFVVVPEVLRKGRLIHAGPMREDPKGHFFHIAAPIRIAGEDYLAIAQIKAPPPPNGLIRLYVHQVFPKEKLRQPPQARATPAAEAKGQTSVQGGAGIAETLLREIYAVKAGTTAADLKATESHFLSASWPMQARMENST